MKIKDLFEVSYGTKLDFGKMTLSENGIPFVSRYSQNNGIAGYVELIEEQKPIKAGAITVTLGGSYVLSAFVQHKDFYTAQNVAVLIPKKEMKLEQKMYYCLCITANRFRYSAFGREANKTLKDITIPDNIPNWVNNVKLDYNQIDTKNTTKKIEFNMSNWKKYKLSDLFDIVGTKTTSIIELEEYGKGEYPYITTQAKNNGVNGFFDFYTEKGNVLVIDSAVAGYCSYQKNNFSASDHVEKLIPKFKFNEFIGLFILTLINKENYKYTYGRKFNQEKIRNTEILLPTKNNIVDWNFIEQFIKELPFADKV